MVISDIEARRVTVAGEHEKDPQLAGELPLHDAHHGVHSRRLQHLRQQPKSLQEILSVQ